MNILRQTSVGAGLTVNLVTGSSFEYPQQPMQVSFGVNGAAAGTFITVYSGARLIAEEFPPVVAVAYPVIPDGFYFNFVCLPGERLVVNARNPTGGAVVHYLSMDLQAIATR